MNENSPGRRAAARAGSVRSASLLKDEFHRELRDAWIERRPDRAEVGGAGDRIRRAEVRRVQQIKDLAAQFDGARPADRNAPHQSEVYIAIGWSADRIARGGSDGEWSRGDERGRAEPVV